MSNLCEDLFDKRVLKETSSETLPRANRKVILLLTLGLVMGSFEELDRSIETMYFKTPAGGYQCTECGYSSNVTTNIVNHIESKHLETPGINCDLCNKHVTSDLHGKHLPFIGLSFESGRSAIAPNVTGNRGK